MIPPEPHKPRHTSRGIVLHDGKILLMERWRPGLHYYSIPGGGIEVGETAEEAAIREIAEETTIIATIDREILQMHDGDICHHIFLCQYISGAPSMPPEAPEAQQSHVDNRFEPGWFTFEQLHNFDMHYWQPIKQKLIVGLKQGFDAHVTVVSTDASR